MGRNIKNIVVVASEEEIEDWKNGKKNEVSNILSGMGVTAAYDKVSNVLTIDDTIPNLVHIGKPFAYADNIDPQKRAYNNLLTRMQVIDLYPCTFKSGIVDYVSGVASEAMNNGVKAAVTAAGSGIEQAVFRYTIEYERPMKDYKRMCLDYGIPVANGIRLYLTDESTATDTIAHQYDENVFQQAFDKLSDMAQNINAAARSLNSEGYKEGVDKAVSGISELVGGPLTSALGAVGIDSSFTKGILDFASEGAKISLKGQRLSLPKIWKNSSYAPSFSVVTKLVSPYGCPEAIYQYIIKPLMYLWMMALPQTQNGYSFDNPYLISLRGYGLTNIYCGTVSSITMRKGGSDSAFSLFKQPLVVEVSIEFESLVGGVAVFKQEENVDVRQKFPFEYTAASQSRIVHDLSKGETFQPDQLPSLMPTMGGFIRSLSPVNLNPSLVKENTQGGIRDYGLLGILDPETGTVRQAASSSGGFGLGGIADFASKMIVGGISPVLNTAGINIEKQINLGINTSNDFLSMSLDSVSSTLGKGLGELNSTTNVVSSLSSNASTLSNIAKDVSPSAAKLPDFINEISLGINTSRDFLSQSKNTVSNVSNQFRDIKKTTTSLLDAPVKFVNDTAKMIRDATNDVRRSTKEITDTINKPIDELTRAIKSISSDVNGTINDVLKLPQDVINQINKLTRSLNSSSSILGSTLRSVNNLTRTAEKALDDTNKSIDKVKSFKVNGLF